MSDNTSKMRLTSTLMISILFIAFLATGLLAVFWMGSEYLQFQSTSQEMEGAYIKSQRDLLKSEVDRVIDYLGYEKAMAENRLKSNIRTRVYEAYALAESLYRKYHTTVSPGAIEGIIMEAWRAIRFNNGRGYFFATRLDGVNLLLADRPELEGHNLLDMQDTQGRYVIRDMIALVRKRGEGYYRYNWTKPQSQGRGHPKIAFVKYFEPFDGYIGTGEYLEDVESDIQKEVIGRIEQIRFGADGYIFVGTYDGVSLTKPAKNRSMWDVQDENGVRVVQELIAKARSGGGFVSYVMPKLAGLPSAPKLSYADRFEPWQWYVGAGIYVDEINAVLAHRHAELQTHIRQHLMVIAATLLGIVALTFLAVRLFTQRLQRTIQSFSDFFARAAFDAAAIDRRELAFQEFDHLAQSANRMVDERRRADQALNESLAWNQTIFDAIQSGIVVIDARAHQVADINPSAIAMIGLTREAIIGRTCHDFLCPAQRGQCPILDLNQAVDHEERVLVRPDGREIPILKTVSRIDVGSHPYLIESFLDISKQKRLEAQLKQAQKMEAIGTLTGGIAHDFNNILGIILGNTELAQSKMAPTDEAYEHLEITKEASLRAKKIVNQLLSYSRQSIAEKKAVNMKGLVLETVQFIRALIPASIAIRPQITDTPCIVYGNATQIHQMLINLCVNASHAVDRETGIIHVDIARVSVSPGEFETFPDIGGANFVELVVRDNGHGIAPEIKDRIFDPYFTTKEVGKGTGMGLAVVLGVVQDHGGAIAIDSTLNRGTSVRVVLPLTDRTPQTRPAATSTPYAAGNAESILFIDDEALLVKLGEDILRRLNYTVRGCTDAAEAMACFRESPERFDLIISDMNMPHMSGTRVVAEARRIRPAIPIIICSGYSDDMDESRATALGCRYIQKPIDIKALADTVRKALAAPPGTGDAPAAT
jgi:two-component system cell cycle sensor histidine kinase/response regulator CckA